MILVLWPTIRPAVALANYKKWLSLCGDPGQVHAIFGVNSTDHWNQLTPSSSEDGFREVVMDGDCRPGVTSMATRLSRYAKVYLNRDIFVLASDDFNVQQGWDDHLIEQFDGFDGALIVKDGYKPKTNIIPIPIMHRKMMERLNWIVYHPEFNHFFSDQELFDIVMEIGNTKDLRGTDTHLFSHKHWSFGGRQRDEFDLRNDTWWDEDKATYERRKKLPLAEKLKLPDWWK